MNERPADDLSHSLRELGESRTSKDFTERVLVGLDRRRRRRARRRAAGFGLAALALAALGVVGALLPDPPQATTREQAQVRASEIRREHDLLIQELEELRRTRDLRPTLLYLGGGDNYDLVLDLNPLLDEMTRPSAAPASFTPASRPGRPARPPRRKP